VEGVTKIQLRTQSYILSTNYVRTLHNVVGSGPDLRGRKRVFSRSDTAAIVSYLDNPSTSFNDKAKLWLDLAEDSGVILSEITHFKPPGKRTVEPQSIQRDAK
jgi:hypothetical protein